MGDYIRWSPPYYEGAHESARSALFLSLNRNKRSIRLDLKNERGREALLRLVREYDVVLESFRPGVLDRLGVGYERMREENPGIVYCAISGYGQDGPKRDASGHDMNYLGLIGLLGLTGERGGEPVQAAGQIADLGGGALMAAFGILAALRERDGGGAGLGRARLGRGPARRRVDGRRRAVVAGDGRRRRTSPTATCPRRGELPLAGSLICYRPYECADGWVTLGALEPKFWQGVLPRRRARGADRGAVRAPRLGRARAGAGDLQGAHARAVGGVRARARLLPGAGARARRGARLRARRARARWSSRSSSPAPSAPVRQLGVPGQARRARPAITRACPARRSASTPRRCCCAAGYSAAARSPSCWPTERRRGRGRRDRAGHLLPGVRRR